MEWNKLKTYLTCGIYGAKISYRNKISYCKPHYISLISKHIQRQGSVGRPKITRPVHVPEFSRTIRPQYLRFISYSSRSEGPLFSGSNDKMANKNFGDSDLGVDIMMMPYLRQI